MYQDNNNKTNYVRILLRIALFVLIFVLAFKLISMIINKRKSYLDNNNIDHNLTSMQDVALKYFKEGTVDLEVGQNKKVTLNELIEQQLIGELKDEHKNVCSKDDSYIEILKLENEYRIKSYIVCGNNSSDKYTYIDALTKEEIKDKEPTTAVIVPTTETTTKTTTTTATTTTTKKTTKKTTVKTTQQTTKATTQPTQPAVVDYYTVGFNTNGGMLIDTMRVKKGQSITLPTPKKAGYTFWKWIDSSNKVYSGTITPTKNLVLIAKWR